MYRVNFPSQGREIRFFVKKNAFVAHWVEQWNAAALHGSLAIHICELGFDSRNGFIMSQNLKKKKNIETHDRHVMLVDVQPYKIAKMPLSS